MPTFLHDPLIFLAQPVAYPSNCESRVRITTSEKIDIAFDFCHRPNGKSRFSKVGIDTAEAASVPFASLGNAHEQATPLAWRTDNRHFRNVVSILMDTFF
ncbi:MAG: hypothetical protein B6D35_12945 [Candidatus Brocadia sp. UTAMX2]|nr:MAG: hypothetical protein B6D35_12945 [Candidatus Brocadia sp. UTAMX2]